MDWILLRGLSREQAHWGLFPKLLTDVFPGHRFHCLDLPGAGVRAAEKSPGSIASIAERVRAESLHLTRPLGLIGLSMGGMVALDWAARYGASEVGALAMVNSSSGFSPPWQRMRPGVWPRVARTLVLRDPAARERAILELTSGRPVSPELANRWVRIQQQHPTRRENALAQLWAAARYKAPERPPDLNAVLLASEGDRIVHWRCSQALADRWHWPVVIHPDAGHDLVLDDPSWVVAQLSMLLSAPAGTEQKQSVGA